MNILLHACAVAVGLLPLVVGCAQPGADEPDEPLGIVASADIGDKNNGTTNGLSAADYHAHLFELMVAMSHPLVVRGEPSDYLLDSHLADTPEGSKLLKYAYECAGQLNVALPKFSNPQIKGQELLSTATSWYGPTALSASAKLDVLECVIARVNSTAGVPVLLNGPNVRDVTGVSYSDYDVSEAVWLVKRDASGGVEHHVWNLLATTDCDEADAWASLKQRICSQLPEEECGFIKETNLEDDCTLEADGYWCDGQPTIATQLKRADLLTVHPGCR